MHTNVDMKKSEWFQLFGWDIYILLNFIDKNYIHKKEVQDQISEIYHKHNGTVGYQSMSDEVMRWLLIKLLNGN